MQLKADVTWNDATCIDSLRTGCAQEICDVLLVQLAPLPATLQDVADLVNKIDLQNRQWAAESGHRGSIPTTQRPPQRSLPPPPVVLVSQRTTTNSAWTGPAPMDLSANSRAAVQTIARAARRAKAMAEGLSFTCGSPDHARAACPVQAQYDQVRALRAAATAPAAGIAEVTVAEPQPAENEYPDDRRLAPSSGTLHLFCPFLVHNLLLQFMYLLMFLFHLVPRRRSTVNQWFAFLVLRCQGTSWRINLMVTISSSSAHL